MELESMQALLDNHRKYLNDAITRAERNFNTAIDKLSKQNDELVHSLQFTQATVDDLKADLNRCKEENKRMATQLESVTRENGNLQSELTKMMQRVDFIDDQQRRPNLRISGVPEHPGENWEQTQMKVVKFFQEKMNMSPSFERVHRVGKRAARQGHPRDIIARFTNTGDRDAALRDRRKLRGTNLFVNEDFCQGTAAERQRQQDDLHSARRQGKRAYFSYRTLVVRDSDATGGAPSRAPPRTPPRAPPASPRTPPPPSTSALLGAQLNDLPRLINEPAQTRALVSPCTQLSGEKGDLGNIAGAAASTEMPCPTPAAAEEIRETRVLPEFIVQYILVTFLVCI